jgi:hypothetical protein
MQQNHQWGVNYQVGTKDTCRIVRTPSLYCRVHNSAPVFASRLPSCLCKIRFNIILPSTYNFFNFIPPSGGYIPTKTFYGFYLCNIFICSKNMILFDIVRKPKKSHTCIYVSYKHSIPPTRFDQPIPTTRFDQSCIHPQRGTLQQMAVSEYYRILWTNTQM